MTVLIEGRIIKGKKNVEQVILTAEEATGLIKEGYYGMLSFFGEYEIEGLKYHASGLSVGDDTYVFEKEGKLIIPTYFRKYMLGTHNDGDQNDKVFVEVSIEPENVVSLCLTLYKE